MPLLVLQKKKRKLSDLYFSETVVLIGISISDCCKITVKYEKEGLTVY